MRNLLHTLLPLFIWAGATSFGATLDSFTSPSLIPTKNTGLNNRPSTAYAPVFSNCPSDISNVMPAPGDCTAMVTWTPPTATGSGTVTVSSNYSPGDRFYPGTHRVIYRATDSNGTSFCEFKVTVEDNVNPTITVPADIVTDVDPGSCTARVVFPNPSGWDNCPLGTGESPLEQDFTDTGGNPEDFSSQCYDLAGTQVGSSGEINGSHELETLSLVSFDTREFTMPITNFNGTGEIFFDHKITAGNPSGIGNNARLTVSLINTSNVATVIFTKNYTDENVHTEYIPIVQSGDFYVRFEFDTDQNRGDIAYLDDIYVPGFVTADESGSGLCDRSSNLVIKTDASGLGSGSQFPVGTTTLRYFMEDAAGNFTFNSFNVTVNNNINPPTGSDETYCEGEPVPQLSVTVASGETVDWYDTPSGGNLLQANSPTYTPPGPGTYYAVTKNTTTGCVSASRTPINLIENPQPSPPFAPSPVAYCVGDPATPLTATGDAGNMIFWYNAPTGGTMYPSAPTPNTAGAGTTAYYVEQIDAVTGCISERTQVDVIVYAPPLAPVVTSPVEYCLGDTAAELNDSATGSNLRWYDAATGGNEIAGTTRPNTVVAGQQFFWVTQSATSGGTTCESNRARLTVNVNTPPTITSQPSDQSICENGNATFTVGASDAIAFQWQLFDGTAWNDLTDTAPYSNTGTNTLTLTGVPPSLNGNLYRAVASSPASSCADALSNSVTLTVNAAPLTPTSGGDQTQCGQDPVQTLTATATPPLGATVVWYDAASGGTIVADPILDAVGTVTYYAQSNDSGSGCPSVLRTPVTLTIHPAPAAPASGGDQTGCEQSPVQTLTATATAPAGADIVWYDAASGGNVVPSPILNSVGTITYYAESEDSGTGCQSASRTPVSLTLQPAATPPIGGGDQTVCEASPIQTLTATATVPAGFSITWFDAPSGGNMVSDPELGSVGTVTFYAESTNDGTACTSTSRAPVTLTIEAAPAAPISGGNQTECETSPTQTMTATATVPAGATIVWYDAATGGNTVGSPTLSSIGAVTYYAESQTNGSGCVSLGRTPVTLTMNASPTLAVTPASPSCAPDLTTYSVSVDVNRGVVTASEGTVTDNGGDNWTISGIGSGNNIMVTVTDANGCSENLSITAPNCGCPTVNAPTSGGNQTACETDPIQTLTATAIPPSGASVIWYDAAINGNVVSSPTLNTIGAVTYYAESVDNVNTCTSATRTPVTLTIQAAPAAPTSNGDQTACETTPTQTLTATATPDVGTSIVWYDAASGGNTVTNPTLNAVGTITYYAESRDNGTNCPSHFRTAVTLTIQPNPAAPTSGGDQIQCETRPIQTLTATATCSPGTSIDWYDAAIGGNLVASPILNSVGSVTYFAESRDNTTACTSLARVPVTLTIQPLPNVVANATATSINAGDPVTLTGAGADSYVWDNGVNDGDTLFPLTTTTYTVLGTDVNGCESSDSITIVVGATSDIRLEKTVDNPFPNVGDAITFTLTATNDGPSDAPGGTIVNDLLPIGYRYSADTGSIMNGSYDPVSGDWTLPALNNGGSVSIAISALVTAPTGPANAYLNIAQVISAPNHDNDSAPNNDDGDQSEDDEAAVSITPLVADLEITNSISQTVANPGDLVTLTVDVLNNGPNDATNVCIENIIPSGFTATSINNGGTQTGNTLRWSGIDIANGATTTLTFIVRVNAPANTPNAYLNTVQITSVNQFDPDSAPDNDDGDQSEDDEDNAEIVLIPADLSLTKTLGSVASQDPNAGDTVTFELTLTNAGPGLATNISVVDQVPGGYAIGTVNNGGVQSGNTITWNIASLAVGSQVFTYEATINAPDNVRGEYTNTAQVTTTDQFDPDSTPNNDDGDQSEDDEASYTVNAPTVDIEIGKTVDKAQTFYGDTLIFTVTATNNGTYEATHIGIEDVLPSGYVLVSHTADLGTYNESIGTWEIDAIAMGETATLEMTVTVTETDDYANIAALIYVDQIDPNLANDRAEATPEVTQGSCLTVFNEFSPNDDGANDFFFIECIDKYPNSLLQIYNRWGNEVFAAQGYDNSWDGTSVNRSTIGTSEKLPVGTYYYTLEPGDGNAPPRSGWIYISR